MWDLQVYADHAALGGDLKPWQVVRECMRRSLDCQVSWAISAEVGARQKHPSGETDSVLALWVPTRRRLSHTGPLD